MAWWSEWEGCVDERVSSMWSIPLSVCLICLFIFLSLVLSELMKCVCQKSLREIRRRSQWRQLHPQTRERRGSRNMKGLLRCKLDFFLDLKLACDVNYCVFILTSSACFIMSSWILSASLHVWKWFIHHCVFKYMHATRSFWFMHVQLSVTCLYFNHVYASKLCSSVCFVLVSVPAAYRRLDLPPGGW